MVAWCGVGLSLLSAILFSSAAICLRGEREREEALNMQYLMPGMLCKPIIIYDLEHIINHYCLRIYKYLSTNLL